MVSMVDPANRPRFFIVDRFAVFPTGGRADNQLPYLPKYTLSADISDVILAGASQRSRCI